MFILLYTNNHRRNKSFIFGGRGKQNYLNLNTFARTYFIEELYIHIFIWTCVERERERPGNNYDNIMFLTSRDSRNYMLYGVYFSRFFVFFFRPIFDQNVYTHKFVYLDKTHARFNRALDSIIERRRRVHVHRTRNYIIVIIIIITVLVFSFFSLLAPLAFKFYSTTATRVSEHVDRTYTLIFMMYNYYYVVLSVRRVSS